MSDSSGTHLGFPPEFKVITPMFVLSYVVISGLHWSWEIVGMLLSGKAEAVDVSQRHNMIERVDSLEVLDKINSPRMINSHIAQPFIPSKVSITFKT